jgi:hypothetical protein
MVTQPVSNAENTTTLDQSDQSATLELYRAALGPINTDYYLHAFAVFDAAGRVGPRWNWAAALSTLNWMVLRQLWGSALAYGSAWVAVLLLTVGLGQLVFHLSKAAQIGALAVVAAAAVLVPGLYGNALLYRHCFKKIGLALERHTKLEDACAMLLRDAPSRSRLLGVAAGNAVLACAALGLFFTVPHGLGGTPDTSEATQGVNRNVSSGAVRSATGAVLAVPPASPQVQTAAPTEATSAPTLPQPQPLPQTQTQTQTQLAAPAAAASTVQPPAQTAAPPAAISQGDVAQPPVQEKAQAQLLAKVQKKAPEQAQAPVPQRYLVNVGLFADEANARRAADTLRQAKQPVLRDRIRSSKGVLNRVRVGPFKSQAEAAQAAQTIQSLQLDAVVVAQELP